MKKILIAIIVLAALLRLPLLGQFPNGFTGDETQQGYSAYSILKTGRDEWGQFLPLNPRGFGDFKPPLYTYLTIPSVAIFGLTPEAVRLPAALVGILSVLVIYFLTKELLKNEKTALLATLFLAISPWHIQLSRTAFEGGLGVLTFSLSLLFFLKSGVKNFALASIFWGITLYTYHSWRVFTALFIIGLLILNKRKLLTLKNWIPCFILIIFIIPLIFNINSTLTRSSDVGILSKNQISGYFTTKIGSPLPPIVEKIADNKFLFVGNQFWGNFLSYFSPTFYFGSDRSDSSYLNFPHFPLLYPIEILFWLAAIYILIIKNLKNNFSTNKQSFSTNKQSFSTNKQIIFLWILLAGIPASLAVGGANANRATTFLPLTAVLSAIGFKTIIDKIKSASIYLGAALLLSLLIYLHFYFINLPQTPPFNLRFGYDQVFKKVVEVQDRYDYIVISKVFTEPQVFIAFYGRVDPKKFQEASADWLRYEKAEKLYVDQLESWNYDKFLFEDINWKFKDSERKNSLIVGKSEDFPANTSSILDVKNPKGEIIYRLVPTENAKLKNAN